MSELVLACWWLGLGPSGPRAGVSLLKDGTRDQGLLGLGPAHWWVKPGLRASGYRTLAVLKLV